VPVDRYLGIDPGASGGIAVVTADGVVDRLIPRKKVESVAALWAVFDDLPYVTRAAVERNTGYVGGYAGVLPGGLTGNTGSSMFKLGVSYGSYLMALAASGIPYDEVMPATWQRGVGVDPRRGATKTEFKNRLRERAAELFPGVRVTLQVSDALLVAEFCRRRAEGVKSGVKVEVVTRQRPRGQR
jgi:hypothetical protein